MEVADSIGLDEVEEEVVEEGEDRASKDSWTHDTQFHLVWDSSSLWVVVGCEGLDSGLEFVWEVG